MYLDKSVTYVPGSDKLMVKKRLLRNMVYKLSIKLLFDKRRQ